MGEVTIEKEKKTHRTWRCIHCDVFFALPISFNGMKQCERCDGWLDISLAFLKARKPEFHERDCRMCGKGEVILVLKRYTGSFFTPCCHKVLYAHPDFDRLFFEEEWKEMNKPVIQPRKDTTIALIPEF